MGKCHVFSTRNLCGQCFVERKKETGRRTGEREGIREEEREGGKKGEESKRREGRK